MPGFRVQKAASFIRDEMTLLLRDKVHDPRVKNLTVTEVTLTPDRRIARIYVANYGTEEELTEGLEGLRSAQGFLRREISRLLHWNYAPELVFFVDRSWHYGQRIDSLLEQLNASEGGEEATSEDSERDNEQNEGNQEPSDDNVDDN